MEDLTLVAIQSHKNTRISCAESVEYLEHSTIIRSSGRSSAQLTHSTAQHRSAPAHFREDQVDAEESEQVAREDEEEEPKASAVRVEHVVHHSRHCCPPRAFARVTCATGAPARVLLCVLLDRLLAHRRPVRAAGAVGQRARRLRVRQGGSRGGATRVRAGPRSRRRVRSSTTRRALPMGRPLSLRGGRRTTRRAGAPSSPGHVAIGAGEQRLHCAAYSFWNTDKHYVAGLFANTRNLSDMQRNVTLDKYECTVFMMQSARLRDLLATNLVFIQVSVLRELRIMEGKRRRRRREEQSKGSAGGNGKPERRATREPSARTKACSVRRERSRERRSSWRGS